MQATKLVCPTCAAKIQISRPLPAGAKGKCPRCQTVFVVPEPEETIVADSGAAPPRLVEDDEEQERRPRKRKKRQSTSSGGLMSYLALIIAGGLVVAFVVVMIALFYYYAFRTNQDKDIYPTAFSEMLHSASSAPGR
jgi:Zn-finger nucleic acid-binding protein